MNAIRKSLLNVITLFEVHRKPIMQTIATKVHCDTKQPQDFYCDAEKPFITNS